VYGYARVVANAGEVAIGFAEVGTASSSQQFQQELSVRNA